MSRRFGRNQRRRLREELAKATTDKERYQAAWQRESGLLQHMREKNERALDTLQEIYEMVSRFSVMAPPEHVEVQNPKLGMAYLPDITPDFLTSDQDTFRVITLHAVQAAVREDRLRHALHATLSYNGEGVAYAISEEAILNAPESVIRRRIEREIVPRLTAELINQIRRRRRV